MDTATEQAMVNRWLDQLRVAYKLAYTQRLRELNGGRVREWRTDGLHEWSYLWGKIDVAEPGFLHDAICKAPALLAVTPVELRAAAWSDATDEFVARLHGPVGGILQAPGARAREDAARARPKTTEETETAE